MSVGRRLGLRRARCVALAAVALLALASAAVGLARRPPRRPSFARDVAPIVRETCAGCHQDGGIAPFAFRTERDLASRAAALVAALETKPDAALAAVVPLARLRRPGASARSTRGSGRRSSAGRARSSCDPAPRGAARPSASPAPARHGAASRRVAARARDAGRVPPRRRNGSTDDYRCFLLDPKLASDAFVTSARIAPGATSLVHHVILYRIAAGAVAEANALDRATPGAGLDVLRRPRRRRRRRAGTRADCSTTPAGSPPGRPAGAATGCATGTGRLAPGGQPDRDAGALQPAERTRPDRSRAVLTTVPGDRALTPVADGPPPGAGRARLPPGRELARSATAPPRSSTRSSASAPTRRSSPSGSSSSAARTRRSPSPRRSRRATGRRPPPRRSTSVAGHMHLLGRSIRVDLNPGTPARGSCSRSRAGASTGRPRTCSSKPSASSPGDVLRVTCRHDSGAPPRHAALRALGRGNDRRDVPRRRPGDAAVARHAVAHPPRLADVPRPGRAGRSAPSSPTSSVGSQERGHELARAVVDRRGGRVAAPRPRARRRRRPRAASAPTSSTRTSSRRRASRDARRARTRRAHRARPGRRERRRGRASCARRPARRSASARRSSRSRPGCARGSRARCPAARGRDEVIDCGVDLERFVTR